MASQTSPENSIHRHHHLKNSSPPSSVITSTTPPSSIVRISEETLSKATPSPAAEQFSSIERQNSYGSKRFFVSRVQYPVEQQQQHKGGYGSHCLRINIAEQCPAAADAGEQQQQQQLQQRVDEQHWQQKLNQDRKVLGSGAEEEEEMVTFRYTWPVRITERLIGTGESAILNVSPAFCTAYNGVQFTWLLRICEEDILPPNIGDQSEEDTSVDSSYFASGGDDDELELAQQQQKKVNITLYYKEGPARDVKLCGGNIFIRNSEGVLFDNMPLPDLEYTKGGGWSPISDEVLNNAGRLRDEQRKFSAFIHNNIGKQITVRVHMKMPASLFQPMQYLPSIESPLSGGKLEALCASVLDEIRQNQLQVPDVEHFDLKTDKYALYRHVFLFGCSEIFERVAVQCAVLNAFRHKKFSFTDQFVLSYGGLRGAIAFGLVMSMHQSADQFPARSMFISTTLAVIFFTVFVQGISIRPLLFWLKVKKSDFAGVETMMSNKIFQRYTDHTMSGLEAILGHRGSNSLRDKFERFNDNVLTPMLMRAEQRKTYDASPIVRAYRKITLHEALQLAQSGSKISNVSRVGEQKMIDIDQFLSNRENVELLYLMFSRMLDRKIEEMQKARLDAGWEDDVKDDYMGIIGAQIQQVENNSICTQRLRKPTKFLIRRESSLPNRTTRTMMNGTMVNGSKHATLAARNGIGPTNRSRPHRKLSLPLPTGRLQWRVARQESERDTLELVICLPL
uniref:Na_H_Exchanger domain-containing protein n=1 Tax=Globodera pallida TaxID=36090 RepID=A0A183C626_GLOPA